MICQVSHTYIETWRMVGGEQSIEVHRYAKGQSSSVVILSLSLGKTVYSILPQPTRLQIGT